MVMGVRAGRFLLEPRHLAAAFMQGELETMVGSQRHPRPLSTDYRTDLLCIFGLVSGTRRRRAVLIVRGKVMCPPREFLTA